VTAELLRTQSDENVADDEKIDIFFFSADFERKNDGMMEIVITELSNIATTGRRQNDVKNDVVLNDVTVLDRRRRHARGNCSLPSQTKRL